MMLGKKLRARWANAGWIDAETHGDHVAHNDADAPNAALRRCNGQKG